MSYHFTSESVTEGHPDKICDQISDAVLDAALKKDPQSHVACECMVTTDFLVISGEIRSKAELDLEKIARKTIEEIGYVDQELGFDAQSCEILLKMNQQSPDIAQGVDQDEQGAGDQGLMFGFACNETPELMPLPITLAHKLTKRLAELRKKKILPYLRPDGKSQVTVQYAQDGTPERIASVVLSTQHAPDVSQKRIAEDVEEFVIRPICGNYLDQRTMFHINPTGRFVIGGPTGDCGLTGRKIIVDTYGGYSRHGGGAFSGKDASKVDRSAAYAARWVAKNIVAAKLATKCEVQIAYAIGVAAPVSVYVHTFGTGIASDEALSKAVSETFDLRPAAIAKDLNLLAPQYRPLAAYGHMGREDLSVFWEQCSRTDGLQKALNQIQKTSVVISV